MLQFNLEVIDATAKLARLRLLSESDDARVSTAAKEKLGSAVANVMKAVRPYAAPAARGAAMAAPLGLVGAGLIHHAGNKAEKLKNDALMGALGVGAATAGMHALARRTPQAQPQQQPQQPQPKLAADNDNSEELCAKVAACVYLDTQLHKVSGELFGEVSVKDLIKMNENQLADTMLELLA